MSKLKPASVVARVLIITLAIFSLVTIGWLSPLQDQLARIFQALGAPISQAGQNTAQLFITREDEIKQLQEEVARLGSEQSTQQLEFENQRLRDQLNFAQKTPYRFTGAEIIGFEPVSVRSAVTLNRGAKDGLEVGMAVLSNGYLVGKIEQVTEERADVVLVNDPTFSIQALDQTTQALGIVRGEIGSSVSLTKVIQGEKLNIGDTIVTSGSQGSFPKGIAVGTVTGVEPTSGTVFQTARLKPGVDLNRVRYVLVITGGYR